MDELAEEARRRWTREGQGVELDATMFQLLARAYDVYVFATDMDAMGSMVAKR